MIVTPCILGSILSISRSSTTIGPASVTIANRWPEHCWNADAAGTSVSLSVLQGSLSKAKNQTDPTTERTELGLARQVFLVQSL